jgi:O-antigen/teichoic acid export membrane protein
LLPKPQADLYASASPLAKIILFLPGAVSTVMFPKISKAHAENGATNRILKVAFAMTLLLSGMVVTVYLLFPDFVVNVLIPNNPNRYLIAPIMQWLGVAMLFLGLANLFMLYGLATDGHAYITIMGLSVLVLVAQVSVAVVIGSVFTPLLLAQIMIVTGLFIVVLSAIYLMIIEKEWRPRYGGLT